MKTFAKILAPAVLAVAAFGAQASELTPGDIGSRPVQTAPAVVVQSTVPAGINGEITAGDIGATPIVTNRTVREAKPRMARPVSQFAIGG
ncbi:MAG: hypothetical protein O9345_18680 [Burkholderiaceae bacterium]|jgi:hypothetical protein|nr:hypothetical protein [Burkholderiales bacterium]MCZ8108214.1 hypothetical protein [Burkholderiales bacterium]MCZ8340147.1 hypothetical protein [Burkholderiaceae bacterium]